MATQKKSGRPKKQVDLALIENLSAIFCTQAEISAISGVSIRTLQRNYDAYIKKGLERGKSSLRRMQWDKCREGNTTMMIWLGKQYLGQTDKTEDTTDNKPLPFID